MRRILHILPHRGGGGEVYVSMLERTPGFVHERLYLSSGRTPRSAAASIPVQLPRLVARVLAADLIHVHGDAAAVVTLPLLRARPSVVTTHGLHLLRRSQGVSLTAIRWPLRLAIGATRAVIATSTGESQELDRLIRRRDAAKLRVILNGVYPPGPDATANREAVRADLGVRPNSILGVFLGELEQRKEPLLAISAAERVQQAGLPFTLALAGAGPLSSAVRAHASDSVLPLGYRADPEQLLAAADVFLLPSSREGMSLALLEALSHGLAVVAADTPGTQEAVGSAGLLFSTGDETAFVAAISRVVSDPQLRNRLGSEARQRALDHFGADRFVAETTEVYTSVLASRSVRG
jgi:glycosyltransferase involved in cell wall biosynthesis